MTDPGRYPIDALARAMGLSVNQVCLQLGVSGSTLQQYRSRGVTDYVAESLAHKAGLHVFEVWPEMLDARIEQLPKCDECSDEFVQRRSHQRFCSEKCRRRFHGRRNGWRRTVAGKAWAQRTSARYYAECGDYVKAQARARYAARQQEARHREDAHHQERELQDAPGAVLEACPTETSRVFPLVSHSPHPQAFGDALEGSAG